METSGRIWPNFELIQAFMHVLIACKYKKDQMKNSGENVMAVIQMLKGSQRSPWSDLAQISNSLKFLCISLLTFKYEMNLIKNVRENVMTLFSHCNPLCCHGKQWPHLAEFRTHPILNACPNYL